MNKRNLLVPISALLLVCLLIAPVSAASELTIDVPDLVVMYDGNMHPNSDEMTYLVGNLNVAGLGDGDYIIGSSFVTYAENGTYDLMLVNPLIYHYQANAVSVDYKNVTGNYVLETVHPGKLVILPPGSTEAVTNTSYGNYGIFLDDTNLGGLLEGTNLGEVLKSEELDTFLTSVARDSPLGSFFVDSTQMVFLIIILVIVIILIIVLIIFGRRRMIVKNARKGTVIVSEGKDAQATGQVTIGAETTEVNAASSVKKCPYCGADVAENATFCESCGKKLDL